MATFNFWADPFVFLFLLKSSIVYYISILFLQSMHRNITFMFDYWTDPGVHLLLLKSSMGNNACNSCRSERAFGTVEEEMPSVVLLKILLLTNYLIFANIFVLEGCLDFCLEKVFDRTFKAQKSATKLQLLKILSYIMIIIFCKYRFLGRQFRCFACGKFWTEPLKYKNPQENYKKRKIELLLC